MSSLGTILVVEDDDSIRQLIHEFLELEGFQVVSAAHGGQAMTLINQGLTPAVILLDLMMPVMTGWEFLEKRVQNSELSKIPVIVLSAATPDKMRNLNATEIIKKPIELETLLEAIKRYLASAEPSVE